MASSSQKKTPCSKCTKASGIFTCRGCGKDFCYRHVAEHRQELNKHMEDLTTHHDQLQETIADQEAQPDCHPLMEKIDTWEEESVKKIYQAADTARQELLTILNINRTKVKTDLSHLTQELNAARNEDDYIETDLNVWIEKLNKLKKSLNADQTIDFGNDKNGIVLIPRISINRVSGDIFERIIGDIQMIDSGRAVVHGSTNHDAFAIEKREYSSGQHGFRFKIEQCTAKYSFLCGILSKTMSTEALASITVNQVDNWRGFNTATTYSNHGLAYFTDVDRNTQKDDIFDLVIDCQQRTISLIKNKRLNYRQNLNVHLNLCPYPWQFFVALFYANDCVRLYEHKLHK